MKSNMDQSADIIRMNMLEQRIVQLRKCFNALYDDGMTLSSQEAVKLARAIEDKLDKLTALEKGQNALFLSYDN